jgi:hypothetical protein
MSPVRASSTPERVPGHCSLRAEISAYLLRVGRAHRFSRRHRDQRHAGRYLPGNQHSCRVSHLAVHRPQHAGDGTARHNLQPIFDQLERHGHQEYGGTDAEWNFGAEDLLPTGRQSRPRDRADRRGDQLHSRVDAGGHRAPVGRAIQRLERSGAPAQPELEHSERAAALRLRHLPGAPGACSNTWRDAANAVRSWSTSIPSSSSRGA